jgi:iron complex outermembrane receptor protein
LGVSREISWNFNAGLRISSGQRLPGESEQFGYYLFNSLDRYDYIGNPELLTEKSRQAEVLFRWKKNKINVKNTFFIYRFRDYIFGHADPDLSAMTPGAAGVKVFRNRPGAIMGGWENNVWITAGRLTLHNSIKWVVAEIDPGEPLPLIPPLKDLLALRYRFKKNYELTLESNSAMRQNRINQSAGEKITPGYLVLNLHLSKEFIFQYHTLRLMAAIENISDRHYFEHLDWSGIPRPGRGFYIEIKTAF